MGIYEVLKDKEKRQIYDRVLVEGLPDWRMPIYYYRRMRKMGLAEGLAYLGLIVTVCQYIINKAAYWERKFTLSEQVAVQAKKMAKKSKGKMKEEEFAEEVAREEEKILGPRPTCYDTLPFQLFRAAKYLAFALPGMPAAVYAAYKEQKAAKEDALRKEREEREEQERREEEKKERKEQAKQRKRKLAGEKYRDRTGEGGSEESDGGAAPAPPVDAFKLPRNARQVWSDQDLAKLARLMKKYPSGSSERWERIADALEREPWEVTKMAHNVKSFAYQVPVSKATQGVTGLEDKKLVADDRMEQQEVDPEEDSDDDDDSEEDDSTDYDDENYGVSVATKEEYVPVQVKEKKKTKGGKLGNAEERPEGEEAAAAAEDSWSQSQQKALETALTAFPKGTAERWDRIAGKVPGKSKEQCMLRFKQLAEMVKKKKEAASSA